MSNQQRDRAIDEMLRRGAAEPFAFASLGTCVDAETLAAWSSGTLTREDAARVDEHLADCSRCQSMLAAFARSEPAAAPWWRRHQVRWLVPLATAATVAAIWVAIPRREQVALPDVPRPVQDDSRSAADAPGSAVRGGPAPVAPKPSESAPATTGARSGERRAMPQGRERAGAVTREADARERPQELKADPLADAVTPRTPAAAPPPPPAAAREESAARDQAAATPLLRSAPDAAFAAPGAAIRWRIVAGQLQQSSTRSAAWQPVPLPSTTLTAGHAPSAAVVWVVGRGGAVFMSDDAGASFARVPFVLADDLTAVVAEDSQAAIVTTAAGRRFRTTDRGLTWLPA